MKKTIITSRKVHAMMTACRSASFVFHVSSNDLLGYMFYNTAEEWLVAADYVSVDLHHRQVTYHTIDTMTIHFSKVRVVILCQLYDFLHVVILAIVMIPCIQEWM